MKKVLQKLNTNRGFTLIELLIVISILIILSSVTLVIMNQKRHVGTARNVRRDLDVQTFSLGFYQYALDNEGNYPAGLTDTPTIMCRFNATDCSGFLDVQYLYGKYVTMHLYDPLEENPNSTGYTVVLNPDGHIVVDAPGAENGATVFSRR